MLYTAGVKHPSDLSPQALPYLTSDLPGIGGAIKQSPEDFFVEELPLYEACGEGTHVYFQIEKREMSTYAALETVARALGRPTRDIGYAGLKDAKAVTRQVFSIEHLDPARVEALDLPKISIKWVSRHRNKLKLGHLRGNRFVIKIRDVSPRAAEQAKPILDVLARRGVPNFFGEQRFGATGENALIGLAVLRGDYDQAVRLIIGRPRPEDRDDVARARELFAAGDFNRAAKSWPIVFREQIRVCRAMAKSGGDAREAWFAVSHDLRRLFVSALQSHLFNLVLAQRIAELDRLMLGDLAWKHINGACFRVEDAALEQPRCDAFEISPTGPLFGRRMTPANGKPGEIESAVLSTTDLDWSRCEKQFKNLEGARRPLRVPLGELQIEAGSDPRDRYLQLSFTLPPGSYATCVTREVCKLGQCCSVACSVASGR